jgi:hypothetical protein
MKKIRRNVPTVNCGSVQCGPLYFNNIPCAVACELLVNYYDHSKQDDIAIKTLAVYFLGAFFFVYYFKILPCSIKGPIS